MSNAEMALHFLFQVGLILAFCQVCASFAKRMGQPPVLVIMAVVTMLMTSPLFELVAGNGGLAKALVKRMALTRVKFF